MTLQRELQNVVCQRHDDVGTQCCDVTEAYVFNFFQHSDVGVQRRDVTERVKFNFFTKLSKFEKTP